MSTPSEHEQGLAQAAAQATLDALVTTKALAGQMEFWAEHLDPLRLEVYRQAFVWARAEKAYYEEIKRRGLGIAGDE